MAVYGINVQKKSKIPAEKIMDKNILGANPRVVANQKAVKKHSIPCWIQELLREGFSVKPDMELRSIPGGINNQKD